MLAEIVNRALAWLQGKAFGHQKMALESTLRLHNDGAARRVSTGIESGLHAQSGFLQARPTSNTTPAVVTANQSATKAGALPCIYRAFLTEVEALGVSSEREADSPVCWKQ